MCLLKNTADRRLFGQLFDLNGGAEGDRTPDLRIANATLSQLSYGPTQVCGYVRKRNYVG
jgi:hypothetical protein